MTPTGLDRLKLDEGFEARLYNDATGALITALSGGGNPTIGYGWNIFSGITETEASTLLNLRINTIEAAVDAVPNASTWQPVWHDIAVMIEYNTGDLRAWTKLIAAMNAKDTAAVQAEIRDSKAYRSPKTHDRYERFAVAAVQGSWD